MCLNSMFSKRKAYYVPGIISLIGIWTFYFYFRERFISKKETCLSIVVPRDRNDDTRYSTAALLRQIANKKQIQIELDGDCKTNQKKMELIRYEARKLNYTKDTTTVINISLTNEMTYGDVVKLVDLCYADKHKKFALVKKSFLIFGKYPWTPEKYYQRVTDDEFIE